MLVSDTLWNSISGNGWLKREEAELLLEVAGLTNGPILEVGCYYGRSTQVLASLGRPVYSVDPFNNFDDGDMTGNSICESFRSRLREFGINNVYLFRQRIEDWKMLPITFAYLDGDHTIQGTENQIKTAFLSECTDICIHDYDETGDVKKAIVKWPLKVINVVGCMAHCRFTEDA